MSVPRVYLYLIGSTIYKSDLPEIKVYERKGFPTFHVKNSEILSDDYIVTKNPFAFTDEDGNLQPGIGIVYVEPKINHIN